VTVYVCENIAFIPIPGFQAFYLLPWLAADILCIYTVFFLHMN